VKLRFINIRNVIVECGPEERNLSGVGGFVMFMKRDVNNY